MQSGETKYFKAQWVVPVVQSPIRNGVVGIEDGVIVFVGNEEKLPEKVALTELGGIILPGLVNVHTHLDQAVLNDLLPFDGDFKDWIQIVTHRLKEFRTDDLESAAHFMMQKFQFEGVAAIGDFVSDPLFVERDYSREIIGKGFIQVTGTHSVIGIQQLKGALNLAAEHSMGMFQFNIGLYNASFVNDTFLDQIRAYLQRSNTGTSIAIHIAEYRDELEFFLTGSGPWRDYLEDLGYLDHQWTPPAKRPILYLNEKGLLNERILLINPIHITREELNLICARQASVCWTPTANLFMKRGRVPVVEMLKKNISVSLGTDSPASNPYMSMWKELKEAGEQFPELLPAGIIQMATINGARALNVDHWIGSIIPGKLDRIGIIVTDQKLSDEDELYEFLVRHGHQQEWYWLSEIEEMMQK